MKKKQVVFILKTSNFKFDGRIHKEAMTLSRLGYQVCFYLKSGDDINLADFPDYQFCAVKKWNVSDTRPIIFQYIADVFFQLQAFVFLSAKKKKETLWFCDPIMFPLVWAVGNRKFKTVWDHHELPPSFILKFSFFKKLFGRSYRNVGLNIHANRERQEYLEAKLGANANQSLVMSNYPVSIETDEKKPTNMPLGFDAEKPFLYLQNSFNDQRGANEIFAALESREVNVVCTGDFSKAQISALQAKYPSAFSRVYYLGYITQKNINWLLKRSIGTIILYKNTSMNQWYCDPNRLYQSILKNVFIITGSNPTIVRQLKCLGYSRQVMLPSDGCDRQQLIYAIDMALHSSFLESAAGSEIFLWDSYEPLLGSALTNI